jgi:hypothetical protein
LRQPLPDGTSTFAEYIGNSFPVTNTKYSVSLYYCLQHFTEGIGLVYLGDYARPGSLMMLHQDLPLSNGQCRIASFLVDGPAVMTMVTPLVRNWGTGDLWIHSLEIRSIVTSDKNSSIETMQVGQAAQRLDLSPDGMRYTRSTK